jgi:HAMP domain-containing protein
MMPYYNSFQQSYTPYGQQMQPQPMMQMQPQQSYATQSNSINWVQGEIGAKAYPVAPGNSVLLMDSDDKYFYIKSADASGMPMLRKYTYNEVVDNVPRLEQSHDSREVDTSYQASREEVKAMKEEIEELKKQIETMTENMQKAQTEQNRGVKNGK